MRKDSTEQSQSLFGYVNKYGKWVIEPTYLDAWDFQEGVASVVEEGRTVPTDSDSVKQTVFREGEVCFLFYTVEYIGETNNRIFWQKS